MAKSRRQPGGQVIVRLIVQRPRRIAKVLSARRSTACSCEGSGRKNAPIRFGCSINARAGLFDRLFNGDGFAAGLMVLCRFRRLGIWRPRPRDQRRENCIPEAYDYLDHRADPLPACCAAVIDLHQGESSARHREYQTFGRWCCRLIRSGLSRLTLYGSRNESGGGFGA
jgi:hypothetical protein